MSELAFDYGEVVTVLECPKAIEFGLVGLVGAIHAIGNHPDHEDEDDPYDPTYPIQYYVLLYDYCDVYSFEAHELKSNGIFDFEHVAMSDEYIQVTPEGMLYTPPDSEIE